MAKKTIAELDEVIKQYQKQKETILQRQKNAEREHSTRQKIVLGGWLLANDLALVEKVKAGLTRDQDRKAFGLEPLQVQKTADNVETEAFAPVFVPH